MANKGRGRNAGLRGSLNGAAKLNESQVIAIREQHAAGGVTIQQIADTYGMDPSGISLIIKRVNWKHI
jgi:hypothetical protein